MNHQHQKNVTNQVLLKQLDTLGILLLLESPKHLEFGIDNISWKVGHKFKGIKFIPLGTHLITYSLKSQNHMFPIHQFVNFSSNTNKQKKYADQSRIHIYRWNEKQAKFAKMGGQQAQGYRQGVRQYHFDAYLGPYPEQNIQFWAANTNYLSQQVLNKLDPLDYFINPNQQYRSKQAEQIAKANIDSQDDQDDNSDNEQMEDLIQEQKQQKLDQSQQNEGNPRNLVGQQNAVSKQKDFGRNIYYSQIPRRINNDGAHINHINIDKSQLLDLIIQKQWKNQQRYLLGQLQYSFVSFLVGQCLDSYDQWKHIIMLFVYSETAFYQRKQLMQDFIVVLYEQIKQFPNDFFYDEIGKDNFLCQCFDRLQDYVDEGEIAKKTRSRITKLLDKIQTQYGYLSKSSNEEQPILVADSQSYF